VIVAHIMGIPIEESVLALAPAGAATVTALAIAGRTLLGRLRHPPSRCPDANHAIPTATAARHRDV